MRLDKLLAHTGYGSRKEVKKLIREGYAVVNGEVITNDDFKVDENNDVIEVFDNLVTYQEKIYLMINKPQNVITASRDKSLPTVLDLIKNYEKRDLFCVGRLDKDTVGLLLITNDGTLAHKLLSPKKAIYKRYYVEFEGVFLDKYHDDLLNGIILDDGYKCLKSYFTKLSQTSGYIDICEGKYHQVKRMFISMNMKVTFLKRVSFGNLLLDENLNYSEYRELTTNEINDLIKLTN